MPLTQFPNGVASFGMPVMGIGEETMTTGNVFFVDSGSATGGDGPNIGTSPNVPFLTIDYAISQCTANNGDIIFVMPGHSESPISNEGIDLDVAGVWVRGIGWGTDRPTITAANNTVAFKMDAPNTRVSNIRLQNQTVNETVITGFDITKSGCIVESCEIRPHPSAQFTSLVRAKTGDEIIIRNNIFTSLTTGAGSTSGLLLDGADRLSIIGNLIEGNFSEHLIDNTTGSLDECKDILISHNILRQTGTGTDLVVEMDPDATGMMVGNLMSGEQALDANVTLGNVRGVENYLADADDTHGVVVPVAASA